METLFIGKNTIFLSETESTNSYAMDLLKNVNPPEGTVVHAQRQLKGRGQRGSRWLAIDGQSLTLSILLKPQFLHLQNQFTLYQISALACHDTISHFVGSGQYDIKIKWPNDILVNRKKICGVLIENVLNGDQIMASVIGIGLNINVTEKSELPRMVSINELAPKVYTPADMIPYLCARLEKYYLMLKSARIAEISEDYLSRFFGLYEWRDYRYNGQTVLAKIIGLSGFGLLKLEREGGTTFEVDVKQIEFIY